VAKVTFTVMRRPLWRHINLLASLVVTAAVLFFCIVGQVPSTPPLGTAFDPSTGIWKITATDARATSMTLTSALMKHSATIDFSKGGIPTISAPDQFDALFAQGYVCAHYRLLEMDLERRLGEGTLAAVVGKTGIASDKLQLTLGLKRTAEAEWHALSPTSPLHHLLIAYSEGVNLSISTMESHHELPAAMTLLHYSPAVWTPVDTLVVEGDLAEELDYTTTPADMALLEKSLGKTKVAAWFPTTPITPQSPYDPGPYRKEPLAPITASIPDSTLTPAVSHPEVAQKSLSAKISHLTSATTRSTDEGRSLLRYSKSITASIQHFGASNNWVVAPSKSENGQALLANDPHLQQTLPSVWYEVAITTPSLKLSGVEVPGIPGILLGRNADVAWGFTNTQNQATLLYKEKIDPHNPSYYFYEGAWHRFRRLHYEIKVAGSSSRSLTVKVAASGPMLKVHKTSYSIWWAGALPSHDLEALYGLWQSKNATDVHSALRHWSAPTQNIAYATNTGQVGIIADGIYPQIKAGTPSLPLKGTGVDAVSGTIPLTSVPQVENPASGFSVSANQRPVSATYPYYIGTVADFFDPGYRADEIAARLSATTHASPTTFGSIETDVTDQLAKSLTPTLVSALASAPLSLSHPDEKAAFNLLKDFDGQMSATSSAAALYWVWFGHYEKNLFSPWWKEDNVPVRQDHNLKISRETSTALIVDLAKWTTTTAPANSAFTLPDGKVRNKNQVIIEAFHQAVATLENRFGKSTTWRWGKLQSRKFPSLTKVTALGYGPRGSGGDSFTPDAADGYPVATVGPSWREIIAMGQPSSGNAPFVSLGVYPGGQSENPLSPWYETWVNQWWSGKSHPLPIPGAKPSTSIARWRMSR
jgi:penicillin amidase